MATPKPGVAVLVGRATGAPRGTNVRTLPWWRAPASWGGFARRFSARSFGRARSLAGGHDFGLAVVLVALAAGMALSVTVDALVLAVKGIAPAGFASRLLINALLLGARMTITVAALAPAIAMVHPSLLVAAGMALAVLLLRILAGLALNLRAVLSLPSLLVA